MGQCSQLYLVISRDDQLWSALTESHFKRLPITAKMSCYESYKWLTNANEICHSVMEELEIQPFPTCVVSGYLWNLIIEAGPQPDTTVVPQIFVDYPLNISDKEKSGWVVALQEGLNNSIYVPKLDVNYKITIITALENWLNLDRK